MALYRTVIDVSTGQSTSVPYTAEEAAAAAAEAAAAAVVKPEHVKSEAQRRIVAITGATSLEACIIKQLNANMRANELNDKRVSGGTLTPEEDAEAQALRNLAAAIKAVRAKSNDIEAMTPIPSDYAADSYWA